MNIKAQVSSIAQGKKLFDLGIKSFTSKLSHSCVMPDPTGEYYYRDVFCSDEEPETLMEYICDAFTTSELFKLLPEVVKNSQGEDFVLSITKDWDNYSESFSYTVGYYNFKRRDWHYGHGRESITEAATDLLITVLEQKDVTAEDCIKRLTTS